MKVIYNRSFLLALFLTLGLSLTAQTSGGPDAFGYLWRDSNDPNGPTLDWIDITTIGTEVAGLADDNSAPGFIDMGMDFHYYWLDYNAVKLGSNGWISFNNISNIAHCFPIMPLPDGDNNLVAALLTDLNFEGNGNPGKMYYHNDGAGKFIVSYHNVPFWVNQNPAFDGDNTFQVIFDSQDSSITFQYLTMEPLAVAGNCANAAETNSSAGIENITGQIGLGILDPDGSAMPPSNYAVKFYYPSNTTFEITDATPAWGMNEDNGGSFFVPGSSVPITAGVANAGNADITEEFPMTAQIVQAGIPIPAYTEATTVDPIALGEIGLATFPDFTESAISPGNPLAPGTYTLTTTSVLTGDLVNGNNETTTEFVIVDTSTAQVILSYAASAVPDDAGSWTNGGGNSGFGVYYEPPYYPFTINAVEAYAIDFGAEPGTESEYTIRLYDDQSPVAGIPGNLLSIAQVPAGSYDNTTPGTGEWVLSEFPAPVTIMSGGFYVGWIMEGNNPGLGLETAIPRSRRTLEFIGGGWAEYRSNNVSEAAIRVYGSKPLGVNVDEVLFANNISVFPNPSHHKVNISSTLEDKTIESIQLFNSIGQQIFDRSVNIQSNQTYTMDLSKLGAGMYYLNLTSEGTTITKKVTLVK